jgi:hypothetical protein
VTSELYGMPVTRFEITELVGDVFDGASLSRDQLVTLAHRRGARSAVLLVLRRLPARRYAALPDLWRELPAIPDVHDPWEEAGPGASAP